MNGETGEICAAQASAELVAIFRRARLLSELDDDLAADLIARLNPRRERFPDGTAICQSGALGDRFWVILSGTVRIVEEAKGGGRYITTRVPGEIIGEAALVRDSRQRTATVVTTGMVDMLVVDFGSIWALKERGEWRLFACVVEGLARIGAERLAQATQQRAGLTADSVQEDELLRRFVPPHALSSTRASDSGVRESYVQEDVVLFFSDVVGFSELAGRLGPERTAGLVRRALDAQAAAIGEHGGEIDKFIGDAVMAYWVVPGGSEKLRAEACAHAVAAAFEAAQAVGKIADPIEGTPVRVRIGLHVGSAFSGNFGSTYRTAFTFIGHDVNVAARLEQARAETVRDGRRELGAIRVSDTLRRHLSESDRARLPHRSEVRVKTTSITLFSGDVTEQGAE